MPRVTYVKKARKDNPVAKKGESYYWWKFRYGGRQFSKNQPARSRLTQSGFLSQLYELEDNMGGRFGECSSVEELQAEVENLRDEFDNLQNECQEALDNMPEHLQDSSSSGELLTERIEALEDWGGSLDGIDVEDYEGDLDEIKEEVIGEIEGSNPGIG